MSHIKNFIDRVSSLENRPGKDLIMSASEAKMLRDEIAKMMVDKIAQPQALPTQQFTEPIVLSGGKFK
jgi:hypothetical protein